MANFNQHLKKKNVWFFHLQSEVIVLNLRMLLIYRCGLNTCGCYISRLSCFLILPHSHPKVDKLKQPLSQVELLQCNSKMSRPKHTQNTSKNLHVTVDLHMCKNANNNHQYLWASLSFLVVSLLILNSRNSVITWIWDAPFFPFHETWVMLTCLVLPLWTNGCVVFHRFSVFLLVHCSVW